MQTNGPATCPSFLLSSQRSFTHRLSQEREREREISESKRRYCRKCAESESDLSFERRKRPPCAAPQVFTNIVSSLVCPRHNASMPAATSLLCLSQPCAPASLAISARILFAESSSTYLNQFPSSPPALQHGDNIGPGDAFPGAALLCRCSLVFNHRRKRRRRDAPPTAAESLLR